MLPYIADMDPMGNDIIKPPREMRMEPFWSRLTKSDMESKKWLDYGKTIFMVQFFGSVPTFCSWFGTFITHTGIRRLWPSCNVRNPP